MVTLVNSKNPGLDILPTHRLIKEKDISSLLEKSGVSITGQETLYDDMAAGASCAPITDYWSYGNRQLDAVGGGLTVSETYGSCMTCDEQAAMLVSTIDFEVDMNGSMYPNGDYDNVVLNGDWPGAGPWNGWGLQLSDDDGDGVYTGSLTLDVGTSFEYVVAVTGSADGWSGWGQQFGQPA